MLLKGIDIFLVEDEEIDYEIFEEEEQGYRIRLEQERYMQKEYCFYKYSGKKSWNSRNNKALKLVIAYAHEDHIGIVNCLGYLVP